MISPALLAAVEALRDRQPGEALVCLDDALAGGLAPELEARARGMRAQALLLLGRPEEARDAVNAAIRAARALGDSEGVQQLRALSGQIHAALAGEAAREQGRKESARVAATPLRELLDPEAPPLEQAMSLLKKADAEIDAGRPGAGAFLAARALDLARAHGEGVREQVYALLTLVRARPEQAEALLAEAWEIADRGDNQAMVTAVAQAARSAGVPLAPHIF
jgi:tetratricopeptide (TPR) repeat protein